MAEKELVICDECGSLFFKGTSKMEALCPECAHMLYGYPNCDHNFQNGRCVHCYWDGSKSEYVKKLKVQIFERLKKVGEAYGKLQDREQNEYLV